MRILFHCTLPFLLGICAWHPNCAANEALASWPGLLGPNRDGEVKGFTAPGNWPGKLDKIWQLKVGAGYGSPVFADNVVYLHTRLGGYEVVRCLELQSGREKWQKSYAVPFRMGMGGERHGKGPKSCPVLSGGRLFTLSITGILSAWDALTGEMLWRRDYSTEFKKNHPYWGVSSSPIVEGKKLIVHLGNDGKGTLLALDVRTGKEIWRQGKDGASYSSPLIVEIMGTRQVIQWNHENLVGVSIDTGRLLWSHHAPHRTHNQNMPTPVFHEGRILLGGENRGIQCLEPRRTGDSWSVKKLWYQEKVALDMSTAVINGGLLFGMSHYKSGQLFCLEPKDGEILWLSPGRVGNNVAFLSVPG
ncbi:MAG: PQQ-binding-like beta-propeller repeat protein, partial [Verrucomicrobiaceae bacterium]|nr:PQQ-binding-like beta-propeller repeat protein [Verrucomicrobiaceae bacterium]